MADLAPEEYHALRDMAYGYLGLYAIVRYHDEMTGSKLAEPEVLWIGTSVVPETRDGSWWQPLLDAGLIELPGPDGSSRCLVTTSGYRTLAAYRKQETRRG